MSYCYATVHARMLQTMKFNHASLFPFPFTSSGFGITQNKFLINIQGQTGKKLYKSCNFTIFY